MSDDVTLRVMRWWDVERLLPLERELFGVDAWSAETWWGELAHASPGGDGRWYVVAEDGGTLIGYAGLSVNGPDGDVMTIAVAPRAQGRGIGARLLDALLDAARARGATQVLLEVRADNDPAQRLYHRRGFEQIAIRRGYYGDTDGLIFRMRPVIGSAGD
ncbi:MAG TPA: ribosomal protein S18-alanine N-acetyltransferase [Actinomycetales bacterium]|nr:ribosomal protein S18-alanine N-acetyltransferase [Actinomycetales bacterium]